MLAKRAKLRIESEGKMADARYLFIGHSYERFRSWSRQFGVSISKIVFVSDSSKARGWYDYHLIMMPGSKLEIEEIDRLYMNADLVFDTRYDYPVTESGKIVKWASYQGAEMP